jgi:alpha-1,6-mannosyltransferase
VPRLSAVIVAGGGLNLAAMIVLATIQPRLGTPLFFACAAVLIAVYASLLASIWRAPADRRRLFTIAILFAVAFRIPPMVPPVNPDNDLMRYVWDGRVQKLGINPYAVTPADAALGYTHTDETRQMPSARARTPYPPAAQLFFRFVVSVHDSSRAMKLALLLCDLLTLLVVWRWLIVAGRSEWLALAYAWNPLVVLEIAHSGHIDALGALWIAATAFWLTRYRTALATIAFVLAVATKLLPIVLAPVLWRRITVRDAFIGAGLLVLLYLPFASGTDVLYGVQSVVQHVRFNGPVFRFLAGVASPEIAARVAVGLGLLAAVWCRWKVAVDDPQGWIWPMAVAIACAPVIFPWYLLYLTPFLLTRSTIPVIAWSCSILLVYLVWESARLGGRWVVSPAVLAVEYGVVLAGVAVLWWRTRAGAFMAPASPQSAE